MRRRIFATIGLLFCVFANFFGQNTECGFLDKSLKKIFSYECDELHQISDDFYIFKKDNKWGLMTASKFIELPNIYDAIVKIDKNVIAVFKGLKFKTYTMSYLKSAKEVPADYNGFSDDYGFDYTEYKRLNETHYALMKNNLWAMASNGDILTPFIYYNIWEFSGKYAAVSRKYNGYIDASGQEKIAQQYDQTEPFINDKAVVTKGVKKGVIDMQNNTVIPFEYDDIIILSSKYFGAKNDSGWVIIDQNNNLVKSTNYDDIKYLYNSREIKVSINDNEGYKKGIIDTVYLNEVVPLLYSDIDKLGNTYRILKDGNYGYIDKNGKELIPPIYKEIEYSEFDVKVYEWEGKYGLININGKKNTENIYDYAYSLNGNWVIANKENKAGVVNTKGEVVIPFKYKRVVWLYGTDYFFAEINSDKYLIDKNNKILIRNEYKNLESSLWSSDKIEYRK